MPSLYTFVDYSADWPDEFQREAKRLELLLGDLLVTVHHIGSTSVPGLAAKPIIDLLPLVSDIQRVDDHTDRLVAAGYRAWGEYGLAGRRFFTKDLDEYRTHNIHIYQQDHPGVERHVAFCEYLRNHSTACREYESLKRACYARHSADVEVYNDCKNAWIKKLEPIAVAWYRERQPLVASPQF